MTKNLNEMRGVRAHEDVLFLVGKHSVDIASVRRCVESLPLAAREQALENLVYLDIFQP